MRSEVIKGEEAFHILHDDFLAEFVLDVAFNRADPCDWHEIAWAADDRKRNKYPRKRNTLFVPWKRSCRGKVVSRSNVTGTKNKRGQEKERKKKGERDGNGNGVEKQTRGEVSVSQELKLSVFESGKHVYL